MKMIQSEKKNKNFISLGNAVYKIPAESNLIWLPLFLALPRELVEKRERYLSLPRNIRKLLASEEAMAMVNDDAFLELVWDCCAWTCWQFFEVPAPKGKGYMSIPGTWGHYSGDFPIWKMAYMMPTCIRRKLELDPQRCFQRLFTMGDADYPWTEYSAFYFGIGSLTKAIVQEMDWQPLFDEIWQSRQFEDYNGQSTKQRDFLRSWRHERTPEAHVSLEHIGDEGLKVDGQIVHEIPDPKHDEQEAFDTEDFYAHFKVTLSKRDMRILEPRRQGCNLAAIAKQVGYSNAGAVSKRIAQIAKALDRYRKETLSIA